MSTNIAEAPAADAEQSREQLLAKLKELREKISEMRVDGVINVRPTCGCGRPRDPVHSMVVDGVFLMEESAVSRQILTGASGYENGSSIGQRSVRLT